ncbi:hypothetical protein [Gymnodinialimonas hymeniacidonis]|uniref:hypothetical protein n=1 Tax=Gymnodinialimonas hymeniacidonis TaxID=3126508 RepID=UPI0034C5D49E
MPELWIRFDKTDAAIKGDDYVELMMLTGEPFDSLFVAHGQKPLLDLFGSTRQEHEILNEAMPAHMRRPWQPSDSPWTEATTGLAMCRNLRRAMDTRPEDFDLWPDMVAHVKEVLEPFERVLARAENRGARFQTFSDF